MVVMFPRDYYYRNANFYKLVGPANGANELVICLLGQPSRENSYDTHEGLAILWLVS